MSPRNEEEEVVVPLRLEPVGARPGGWRGQLGSLVAVGLAAFVVMGLVLGSLADRGEPAHSADIALVSTAPASSARVTPYAGPARPPAESPLPTIQVIGGMIPTERRLVRAMGLQVLDLATGALSGPSPPMFDWMLPVNDDELVCACLRGAAFGGDRPAPPVLQFGRFRLSGEKTVQRQLLSFGDVVPVQDLTEGVSVASTLSDNRRTMYVLAVARRPPVWSIDLYVVDARTGRITTSTSLGRLPVDIETSSATPSASAAPAPGGAPPDGLYAWTNWLSAAPDGRTLFASIQYADVKGGEWTYHNREWMVPIRLGQPDPEIRLKAGVTLGPDDWCLGSPTFLDSLAVQFCVHATSGRDASYFVRRLSSTGESLGDVPVSGLSPNEGNPASAVVDRSARTVLAWGPGQHMMARIAVDTGGVLLTKVQNALLPPLDLPNRASGAGSDPSIVESPDGSRVYALGFTSPSQPAGRSTGVWVFDARTLELVDHWEPRALLNSLAVSADGRFVYATGLPGFDLFGHENGSPASVTVYDAASGEIQVIYGAVGNGDWVTFATWP